MVVPLNHPCSKDFPLPSSCWGTVIAQIKASAKAHVQRRTSRPPVRRCANCHLCCPRPPAPVAAGRDQSPQPRGPTLGGKWSFLQQGLTNEGYVCIYIYMGEREIISVFRIVFPLVCLNRNKHVRLSDMLMAQKNLDKYQGTSCGCNALLECCSARLQLTHPTFTIEAGLWHRMHGWYIATVCLATEEVFECFFLGQAL